MGKVTDDELWEQLNEQYDTLPDGEILETAEEFEEFASGRGKWADSSDGSHLVAEFQGTSYMKFPEQGNMTMFWIDDERDWCGDI